MFDKHNPSHLQEYTTKLTVAFIYALLYAVALNIFWRPGNIYAGGLTGLSQIITALLSKVGGSEVPISLVYYLLNVPLFVIAWFKIDKKLVVFTIISVSFASLAVQFVPSVTLTNDPIICAIFGGALNGLSLGFAFRNGISTGGLDIVIISIRRATGKSIGMISSIINGLIVLTAGYLFGWPYAFYSVLSIFVSGKVTDVIYTKQQKMQVMIITSKAEQVIAELKPRLQRGVTILSDAEGAYNHQKKKVLITIITRFEMDLLEEAMAAADPQAFISISEDVRILGNFEETDIL